MFGADPAVCVCLWKKVDPVRTMAEIGTPRYEHMLWGLYFLRVYNTDNQNACAAGGVDEKTFNKWAHAFVEAISFLEYPVVSRSRFALLTPY